MNFFNGLFGGIGGLLGKKKDKDKDKFKGMTIPSSRNPLFLSERSWWMAMHCLNSLQKSSASAKDLLDWRTWGILAISTVPYSASATAKNLRAIFSQGSG